MNIDHNLHEVSQESRNFYIKKPQRLAIYHGDISTWEYLTAPAAIIRLKNLFSHAQFKVIKELFYYLQKYPFSFPSRQLLKDLSGVGLSTIDITIAKLHNHNIIWKHKRAYNSNSYELNPYWARKDIQQLLKAFLANTLRSSFKTLSSQTCKDQSVLIYKEYNYINTQATKPLDPRILLSLELAVMHHKKPMSKRELYAPAGVMFDATPGSVFIKKGEAAMNSQSLLEIRAWNEDKSILTTHGMIKLAVYPPEILRLALNKPLKAAKDPFAYLIAICNSETKQRGIVLNWSLYPVMRRELGVAADDEMYINDDKLADYFKKKQQHSAKPTITPHNSKKQPTYDKWGTKQPDTVEEFMQVRRDVVAHFEQELANGQGINPFAKMLLDAFKTETENSPANPFDSNGPTVKEIQIQLMN